MAYIGKDSLRKRIRLVQEELLAADREKQPLEAVLKDCARIQGLETLKNPAEEYMQWQADMGGMEEKGK